MLKNSPIGKIFGLLTKSLQTVVKVASDTTKKVASTVQKAGTMVAGAVTNNNEKE
jgi:hypothetical protein